MVDQVEVVGLRNGTATRWHASATAALGCVLRARSVHGLLRALPTPTTGHVQELLALREYRVSIGTVFSYWLY